METANIINLIVIVMTDEKERKKISATSLLLQHCAIMSSVLASV